MRPPAAGLIAALACLLALGGCSREAADWSSATRANTPEAYQLYLQQHPRGVYAAQAEQRIEQLAAERDWQLASAANTREAYEQFVARHPDSRRVQEARVRIESLALAATVANSTGAGHSAAAARATGGVASARGALARRAPRVSGVARPAPATRAARQAHLGHRSGAAFVQLGAFSTRARAETQWRRLRARFPAQLGGLRARFVPTRGRARVLYRLQVRVSSRRGAEGLCAVLRRHAQPCLAPGA